MYSWGTELGIYQDTIKNQQFFVEMLCDFRQLELYSSSYLLINTHLWEVVDLLHWTLMSGQFSAKASWCQFSLMVLNNS